MAEEATRNLAVTQRKNALVDNISSIPPFSGDSSVSLGDFLEKWEDLSVFFEWNENEKKFALLNRISGTAARLLKLHKSKTCEELVSILKNRYYQQETPDVSLSKFLNFKQPPTMSVQEFFDRASDLSLRALVIDGMAADIVQQSRNAMLHSMLLNNLSPEIRKGVISKDPKTPGEILKFALLEEKACRSINPFYTMENTVNTPVPPLNVACAAAYSSKPTVTDSSLEIEELRIKLDLLTAKIDSLAEKKVNESSAQSQESEQSPVFYCFRCGQPNHYASNCPINNKNNFQQGTQSNSNGRRGMARYNSYQGGNNYQNNYRGGNYRNRGGNYRGRNNNNRGHQQAQPQSRQNYRSENLNE